MKKRSSLASTIKAVAATICVASMCACEAVATEPPTLDSLAEGAMFRYVHWNIGHFALGLAPSTSIEPAESARRAGDYRAQIERLHPDFLGLSEFEPVFDKAGRLATNEVFAAFPTKITGPRNDYQCNALFSRFPCVRRQIVSYETRRQKTYFIDSVFMFGTNEVHVVQSHLDWHKGKDGKTPYAFSQMRQLIEWFGDAPYVIISADFNVSTVKDYSQFVEAGYTLANGGADGAFNTFGKSGKDLPAGTCVLDNIVVKGFDMHGTFTADNDYGLSDHKIIGCNLTMKRGETKHRKQEQ